MIDEEHDRLVLGLLQGSQVKPIGDLDLRVLQALWQRPQHGGADDVAALDRDEFISGDRGDGDQTAALDAASRALARFRGDVAGDKHRPVLPDGSRPWTTHGAPQPPTQPS